ncbi:MAG: DUF503 domain-containing protein [Planctomycetota bacterium]
MATIVGVAHLEFRVPGARSLKDKRRFIKSFKDRTRNRFNASIAEVADLDTYRSAVLAVAMVANDRRVLESSLQQIVNRGAMHREMVLTESEIEFF